MGNPFRGSRVVDGGRSARGGRGVRRRTVLARVARAGGQSDASRSAGHARDETGRVTDLVSRQDGRYLGTFERGPYQGVAVDHFVSSSSALRCLSMRRRGSSLTGSCIRPTAASTWRSLRRTAETSRAVAGSTGCCRPLDRRGAGSWVSGRKEQNNPDRSRSRRARRRFACAPVAAAHQSEIYWDSLGFAVGVSDAPLKSLRLDPARPTWLSRVLGDPEREA